VQERNRVLCVGGAGFLGSHIGRQFEQTGRYECTQADIWSAKLRLRFENEPFSFVHTDITRDDGLLDELVAGHDTVFNMASKASPRHYVSDPLEVLNLNLFNGQKVIRACVRHKKRLVHFSTSEVYGKSLGSEEPFREDETDCVTGPIGNQRWIYSATKQILDRMVHAYGMQEGLDYTIVRPFNAIGPLIDHVMTDAGDGHPRVFSHFMSALMNGEPLRLVDGGFSRRTFIHVEDLVSALLTIMDNAEATNRQIINIGNPNNEIEIRDLAERMKSIFLERFESNNGVSEIVPVSGTEFYGEGFEDTDRRMPDISKLRALGWSPKIGLKQLLDDTMAYTWNNRHRLTQSAMDALE